MSRKLRKTALALLAAAVLLPAPALAGGTEWLDGYAEVPQAMWPEGPSDDPVMRLGSLLRAGWDEEGRPAVSMAAERDGSRVLVEITKTGYADDSVDGERHRAIVQNDGNGWDIAALGVQFRCHRGAHAGQWSSSLCP